MTFLRILAPTALVAVVLSCVGASDKKPTAESPRRSAIQVRNPTGKGPSVPAVSPEKDFDWAAIRTVNSPSEGAGGVLILTDAKGKTLVAKLATVDPVGSAFADFALTKLGVSSSQTLVLSAKRLDSKQKPSFFDALEAIRAAVNNKPSTDADSARVIAVYKKGLGLDPAVKPTADAIGVRYLLLMNYIKSVSNLGSFANVVAGFSATSLAGAFRKSLPAADLSPLAVYIRGWDSKTDADPAIVAPQTPEMLATYWASVFEPRAEAASVLFKALAAADGKQAGFLGRLIVVDAFLGNEDRFKPGFAAGELTLNSGNLILTPEGKFVAIDNMSDPADPRMIALRRFREDKYDECYEKASATPVGTMLPLEGDSTPLTRAEWLAKVINGYRLETGPTPSLPDVMGPRDGPPDTRLLAAAVTTNMKGQVQLLIEAMRKVNPRFAPRMGDAKLDDAASLKADTNVVDLTTDVWSLQLMTKITVTAGKRKYHITTAKIDWKKFEAGVQAGIDGALKDVTTDATYKAIGDTLSGAWKEGLAARRGYWKSRLEGKNDADARKAVLAADASKSATHKYSFKLEYCRTDDPYVPGGMIFVE